VHVSSASTTITILAPHAYVSQQVKRLFKNKLDMRMSNSTRMDHRTSSRRVGSLTRNVRVP
jgi:hypothetical protein